MNKVIKYIWVVETENIHSDGKSSGKSQSFFSTEGKAKSLVDCPTVDDRCESNLKSGGRLKQEMKYT